MVRAMMRNNRVPGAIPMPDPSRMRLQSWSLLDLIATAYSVSAGQVSGPAWISDLEFDVEAKVPEGTPKEQLNAMLQSLLEERFGLKAHRETQTKQGFALVVAKNGPKLKPAAPDPAQDLTPEQRGEYLQARMAEMRKHRQEMQEGVSLNGLSTSRWDSVTSEELASRLARFTEAPVVDQTGLTGKYSVEIETWKNVEVPGGTIFDAVEKLGLKLESRKLIVETVVVDQVSRTPTAN